MNDTQENKSFTRNAPDGMGYVKNETRTHIACTKLALLTLAGIRTAEYCGQTAKDRMVNIKNKMFTHEGWAKVCRLEWTEEKRRSTAHSTPGARWSASPARTNIEQKAAANSCRSEWRVRTNGNNALNTRLTGWSTSAPESAEPKAAASS